eukprot:218450-Pelagomonas_calceolata.AAC.1
MQIPGDRKGRAMNRQGSQRKRVSVQPKHGVKQGCPLSPLLLSIYVNDIGRITEGATGAVTGLPNFH